jgi:hypothetical protein
MKNKLFLLLAVCHFGISYAQVGDNYFISSPSAVPVQKGLLDFRIYHLFGDIAGDNGGISTFYGFDNVRDIKFSFDYGVSTNLSVGIARTKGAYNRRQNFVLNSKYTFLEIGGLGKKEKGFLGGAIYLDATATTMEASLDSTSELAFTDFPSRLSYNTVAVLQYNNDRWDFMVSGIYNHRNFVANEENNATFATILGAKYAVTNVFRLGLDALLPTNNTKPGLTLDFEFDTGGHVFQLYLSQYSAVSPDQNLLYGFENINDGAFRFGFMISRPFKL